MSSLEERMADLEKRVALLEARDTVSGAPAAPHVPELTAPKTPFVSVTISNKRYDPVNPGLGSYEDHIWFDCVYALSKDAKPTRAVKGALEFADLFGEVRFRLQTTLNEPLTPGKSISQPGIGFTYNQFLGEHQWMLGTDLKDIKVTFRVMSALYNDGTTESFV